MKDKDLRLRHGTANLEMAQWILAPGNNLARFGSQFHIAYRKRASILLSSVLKTIRKTSEIRISKLK